MSRPEFEFAAVASVPVEPERFVTPRRLIALGLVLGGVGLLAAECGDPWDPDWYGQSKIVTNNSMQHEMQAPESLLPQPMDSVQGVLAQGQ